VDARAGQVSHSL